MSLERERAEKVRQRDKYIESLNFYGGQKKAERINERLRQQALSNHDLNNMEKYVQKELDNERNYRERFELSNKRMQRNAQHLVTTLRRGSEINA